MHLQKKFVIFVTFCNTILMKKNIINNLKSSNIHFYYFILELGDIQYDGLEYVAGYVLRNTANRELTCETSVNTYSFVDQVSQGGLWKPSATAMHEFEKMEKLLEQFFGELKKRLDDKVCQFFV